MTFMLKIIVAVVVIEAVCDIVTDSDLFAPLREGLLPDPDTEAGRIVRETRGVKAFLRRYAGGLLQCIDIKAMTEIARQYRA